MNCIKTDRRLVPKPNNKKASSLAVGGGTDAVTIATWMYSSSSRKKQSFPQRLKLPNFAQTIIHDSLNNYSF